MMWKARQLGRCGGAVVSLGECNAQYMRGVSALVLFDIGIGTIEEKGKNKEPCLPLPHA